MIQSAISTQPSDVQRSHVVASSQQSKPIKVVIVPSSELSESPRSAVTEMPYKTSVNYSADDDHVPTSTMSRARVDHVTTQPRSHGTSSTRLATTASSQHSTSGQLINVQSPSPRDAATRILIGDPVDRDKHR